MAQKQFKKVRKVMNAQRKKIVLTFIEQNRELVLTMSLNVFSSYKLKERIIAAVRILFKKRIEVQDE